MASSIQYPAIIEPLAPYVESVAEQAWQQPQQGPVVHRKFRPPTESVPLTLDEITPEIPIFDPANGFSWPTQQSPVDHRAFWPGSGAANGVEPTLLEEVSRIIWAQPQQSPVAHHRFVPPSGVPTRGPDESDFAAAETVTLDKWWQPSQPPVAHRPFRPGSGSAAGAEPTLLEEVTRLDWRQPQQPPSTHRRFVPGSTITAAPDESTFGFDVATLPLVMQQSPVAHRTFWPASGVVDGVEPTLLEEVSRIIWAQPQQPPIAHQWFTPPSWQTVTGLEDDTFSVVAFVEGSAPTWQAADPGIHWVAGDPGTTWRAKGETDVKFATLEHLAGWSRVYNADFGDFAEIEAGQTISTVSSWSWPSGITAGSAVISGDTVQIRLSGATAAAEITATCTVTTSGGDTLSQKTPLKIVV